MIVRCISANRRSRYTQHTDIPQPTAASAWKILFLSSSRCSRKLIEGIGSGSVSGDSNSVMASGIGGVLLGRIHVILSGCGIRRCFNVRQELRRLYRTGRWLGGRQNLLLLFSLPFLLPLLDFKLADLGLDLRFELVERLAHLAGDLRQLLWPEYQQGQNEEEDRLRKIHGSIIAEGSAGGNEG